MADRPPLADHVVELQPAAGGYAHDPFRDDDLHVTESDHAATVAVTLHRREACPLPYRGG